MNSNQKLEEIELNDIADEIEGYYVQYVSLEKVQGPLARFLTGGHVQDAQDAQGTQILKRSFNTLNVLLIRCKVLILNLAVHLLLWAPDKTSRLLIEIV